MDIVSLTRQYYGLLYKILPLAIAHWQLATGNWQSQIEIEFGHLDLTLPHSIKTKTFRSRSTTCDIEILARGTNKVEPNYKN